MKVAIIGTRNPIVGYDEWVQLLSRVTSEAKIEAKIEAVVSGGAKGVDSYAAHLAAENGISLIEYLPEYSRYGRKATIIRNRKIVEAADVVIAFPSPNTSKGTYHSIDIAKRLNKKLIIHNL